MTIRDPQTAAPEPETLRKFLLNPNSHPEHPAEVKLVETHISEVFIADSRVYKLKKPVHFDFLDFSTVAKRKQACEDEVRLNRRLAPEVYLGLSAVTVSPSGVLAIDGDGEPVDWLVKMRRLHDDQSLLSRIQSNDLSSQAVSRVAEMLTKFFREQPPVSVKPDNYRRLIHEHVAANRQSLLEVPDHFAEHVVKRVHTAQLLFLHTATQQFDDRVCDGRLIEGHGDLRPEHIYLTPQPLAIDCVEFNKSLRQLDVLDELSFLAMECAALNAESVGEQIIDHYLKASGDHCPAGMLEFYMTYRACVRTKVCLLQAHKSDERRYELISQAARYLSIADKTSSNIGSPLLIVVRGLAGVGKTTLARHLADAIGAEHCSTDAIRRDLFGDAGRFDELDAGVYTPENRWKVYQSMFDRAARLIANGVSVVLDGTFLSNQVQTISHEIGTSMNATMMMVNCWCAPEIASQRLQERKRKGDSLSDADQPMHDLQRQQYQTPSAKIPQCEVDTSYAVATQAETVFAAIKESVAK